jgi:GT2 family glycosyltransferase
VTSPDHIVAVCICTRHRADDLREALVSLAAGRDAIVARQSAIPAVYTHGPGAGLAANRNHALRFVTSPYVIFLDDDARLGSAFLDSALRCLERFETEYGTGQVLITGPELNRGELIRPSDQDFLGFQRVPYERDTGLNSIVINSTLFPAELTKRTMFDRRLRYGSEEVDIATRLVARGATIVFCASAINLHLPAPSGREDHAYERETSRLYATLKRYVFTFPDMPRAARFLIVAPLHGVVAGLRHGGPPGALRSIRAAIQAARSMGSFVVQKWRGDDEIHAR